MERGLKIPQTDRTKTTNSLIVSLIKQLEKDKKSLELTPDDSLHIEGFALNVFAKADKQDRAGHADKSTAKTFYAASIFFEILNQFGPLQPDLEQKQKYAAWKAVDISKALKEGRTPVPGPPGGDNDLSSPGEGFAPAPFGRETPHYIPSWPVNHSGLAPRYESGGGLAGFKLDKSGPKANVLVTLQVLVTCSNLTTLKTKRVKLLLKGIILLSFYILKYLVC